MVEYSGGANATSEAFQYWKQLALAGLIEGSYSGLDGVTPNFDHDFGVNSPKSRVGNGGWSSSYFDNTTAVNVAVFNFNYINWMTVGSDDSVFADGTFLKPEEAWNLDTKMDDSKPTSGRIHVLPVGCTTASGNTDRTGSYLLTSAAADCAIIVNAIN